MTPQTCRHYFCDTKNKYHWCHLCFADLKEGETIDLGDCTLYKADLIRKKNDEEHEESWVGCDECSK